MSRDYRLRVSSPYFLYLYVQKCKSVASVGPRWPWARVPCTLCTPYCHATALLNDIWRPQHRRKGTKKKTKHSLGASAHRCFYGRLISQRLLWKILLSAVESRTGNRSMVTNTSYQCNNNELILPERDYVMFGFLLSQIRLSVGCLSKRIFYESKDYITDKIIVYARNTKSK